MKANKKKQKGLKAFLSTVAVCGVMSLFQTSCLSEYAPGNYYTFTGETVADFLENNSEEFSNFIYVLKQAKLWNNMKTYGHYTCFAPTNDGWDSVFAMKGVTSVEQLSQKDCDTIAMQHLVEETFYTSQVNSGDLLPFPNLLDYYMLYSCRSETDEFGTTRPVYMINNMADLISANDTMQNGVVHVVSNVVLPSNDYISDSMGKDSTITLLYQALDATGLRFKLREFIDENYKIENEKDSCEDGIKYSTGSETERGVYPAKRYIKFTVFAEPDEVMHSYGINNMNELVSYITPYMEESFPEIQGNYDPSDYTDPNHPLYKFVAYHILPEQIAYGEFNVTNKEPEDILSNYVKRSEIDIEDFYESYLPHAIMRISTPEKPANIFINRKGVAPVEVEGVMIMNDTIPEPAKNGVYYYINKMLMYDKDTRNIALNTRLRFDAMTLSPDFINSGARNRKYVSSDPVSTAFKNGFVKNFSFNAESKFYVRYRNHYFSAYEGDDMSFKGIYDITFKLPPVPTSGTYEVRLGYFAMKSRGVVQIYFGDSEDNNSLAPCGIPLDLRIIPNDPKIGWLSDSGSELNNNEDKISAYDKAMRSRGYMKAPDCYASSNTTLREQGNATQMDGSSSGAIRRILVTQYLDCNQDYYVRFRQVLDNDQAEFQFDYMELVPKSVYAGTTPEDRH